MRFISLILCSFFLVSAVHGQKMDESIKSLASTYSKAFADNFLTSFNNSRIAVQDSKQKFTTLKSIEDYTGSKLETVVTLDTYLASNKSTSSVALSVNNALNSSKSISEFRSELKKLANSKLSTNDATLLVTLDAVMQIVDYPGAVYPIDPGADGGIQAKFPWRCIGAVAGGAVLGALEGAGSTLFTGPHGATIGAIVGGIAGGLAGAAAGC